MRILAIDTALANCAAAVLDDGTERPCQVESAEEIGRGHAERLMDMIGDVMAESGTVFTDLDRIVVTTGPGSFTGLRVGLSVAKGFGLVLEKPVVGVTTLASIARSFTGRSEGIPLFVALDGKADEVYGQLFDADGAPASEPGVRKIGSLPDFLPEPVCFAGSAADRIAQALGYPEHAVLSTAAYPEIVEVGRLGMETDPKSAVASPLYLRPPDATPQKKGRIERK